MKREIVAVLITVILVIGGMIWYNNYLTDGEYEYMTVWFRNYAISSWYEMPSSTIDPIIQETRNKEEGLIMVLEPYNRDENTNDMQLVFYDESDYDFDQHPTEKLLRDGSYYSGLTWYMTWNIEKDSITYISDFRIRGIKTYQVTYIKNKVNSKWYPCFATQGIGYDISAKQDDYGRDDHRVLNTAYKWMDGAYTHSAHYQTEAEIREDSKYQDYYFLETSEWAKEQAKASYEKYHGRKVIFDEPIKTSTLYSHEEEPLVTIKWKNVKFPVIPSEL